MRRNDKLKHFTDASFGRYDHNSFCECGDVFDSFRPFTRSEKTKTVCANFGRTLVNDGKFAAAGIGAWSARNFSNEFRSMGFLTLPRTRAGIRTLRFAVRGAFWPFPSSAVQVLRRADAHSGLTLFAAKSLCSRVFGNRRPVSPKTLSPGPAARSEGT